MAIRHCHWLLLLLTSLWHYSPTPTLALSETANGASSSTTTTYQLKYFNARGAAETSRLLFATAEVDYEDVRFGFDPKTQSSPGFQSAVELRELVANMNRAPVLVVTTTQEDEDDDKNRMNEECTEIILGQSKTIERYLARTFGLMGTNDLEAAQIDCITEHCRDIKDAQQRKRFSAMVKDRSDEEKEEAKQEWFDKDLPALLRLLEGAIQVYQTRIGIAVGSSLSLADLTVWGLLKDGFPQYQEQVWKAVETCSGGTTLGEICDMVESDERVKGWLEKRPETGF